MIDRLPNTPYKKRPHEFSHMGFIYVHSMPDILQETTQFNSFWSIPVLWIYWWGKKWQIILHWHLVQQNGRWSWRLLGVVCGICWYRRPGHQPQAICHLLIYDSQSENQWQVGIIRGADHMQIERGISMTEMRTSWVTQCQQMPTILDHITFSYSWITVMRIYLGKWMRLEAFQVCSMNGSLCIPSEKTRLHSNDSTIKILALHHGIIDSISCSQ